MYVVMGTLGRTDIYVSGYDMTKSIMILKFSMNIHHSMFQSFPSQVGTAKSIINESDSIIFGGRVIRVTQKFIDSIQEKPAPLRSGDIMIGRTTNVTFL